jgi:hypothetical protein
LLQAQRSLSETLPKRSDPSAAKRQRSNTVIGYIEGKILKREEERVLLLANQVGYEILLPAFVMENIAANKVGDAIALYIYYQQTERQPKPILIGFNLEAEKEFFQYFISVEEFVKKKKKNFRLWKISQNRFMRFLSNNSDTEPPMPSA